MKKTYEKPKAEKLEFNYTETVLASNGCGGAYQKYTQLARGCDKVPTGVWVHPFNNGEN